MSGQRGFWNKRAKKLAKYSVRSRNYRKAIKAGDHAAYAGDRAYNGTDLKFKDWLIDQQQWEQELRFEYYSDVAAGLNATAWGVTPEGGWY